MRSSMLEVLDSEYIKLARAKGVDGSKVIWKHALRNSLIVPITVSALLLWNFVTGTVVVEAVFAWPGLGLLAIEAVVNNNLNLVVGTTLVHRCRIDHRKPRRRRAIRPCRPTNQVELNLMATDYQLPEYAQTGAWLPAPVRSVLRGPIAVYDFLRRYPIIWTVVFASLVVLAVFAPVIAPHDPIRDADFTRVRNPPIWLEGGAPEFWLGTDQVGRDLWSRLCTVEGLR